MADDSKTFVFEPQNGSMDPATLLAYMNNNGGFGNGNWIWFLFLFLIFGRGFNNWDNNGNGAGRDLLMQAIQGNRTALSELSTNLNCSIGQVQTAINALQTSIQSVGNQVGMSGMQVINSIQAGNAALASQLSQCCCENRLSICQQTNTLQNTATSNTQAILAKLDSMENTRMQEKIAALQEEKSNLKGYISNQQQTAQISAMIAPLQAEIAGIKCKLPETVNVPYSPVTAIPSCVAYNYGLNALGLGPYNNGSIWS